jgi:hypothetical protein
MVIRRQGSRAAAREGGIRAKLPGPAPHRLPADKQALQLEQRIEHLQDGGKFRHKSAAFRTRLMIGVEHDWNALLQQSKSESGQKVELHEMLNHARVRIIEQLQRLADQTTRSSDDGQVVAESTHVIKRMQQV